MNKKILAGLAALVGVVLLMGSASAATDDDELPPVPPPDPDPDDDSEPIPEPKPDPKPPPSGKDPPNTSNDPAGYNTQMFQNASGVRQWFVNMGYSVTLVSEPLIKNSQVKKFQRDYNTVASRPGHEDMGTLDDDGTAGKNTLNALEIAFAMATNAGKSWNMLVKGI